MIFIKSLAIFYEAEKKIETEASVLVFLTDYMAF